MCGWLYDIFCCRCNRSRARTSPTSRGRTTSMANNHKIILEAAATYAVKADAAAAATAAHPTLHASATAHAMEARTTQSTPTPNSAVTPPPGLSIVIEATDTRRHHHTSTLEPILDVTTPPSQAARSIHAAAAS